MHAVNTIFKRAHCSSLAMPDSIIKYREWDGGQATSDLCHKLLAPCQLGGLQFNWTTTIVAFEIDSRTATYSYM